MPSTRSVGCAGSQPAQTLRSPATERRCSDRGAARILLNMGKPPTFIERIESPNIDHEKESELHAAPKAATKLVYIAVIIGFVVLFLLVGIGLHIPSGG